VTVLLNGRDSPWSHGAFLVFACGFAFFSCWFYEIYFCVKKEVVIVVAVSDLD
jgi:hypothetical protein